MKMYLSGMAKTRMGKIKQAMEKFRKVGYKITYDWTESTVKKPYRVPTHRQHNLKAYRGMLEGAAQADIFILFDGPGLRGAYVELGAFLYEALKDHKNKKVFIVGKDSAKREHIFESPSFVHFVDDINQVYEELK